MIALEVAKLASAIQVRNFSSLMDFGADQQKKVAEYSNFLSEKTAKMDDRDVREHLGKLLHTLGKINLKPFARRRFLFWWLPPKKPSLEQSGHYQRLLVELDYVAHRLEKANDAVLKDAGLLETFYIENSKFEEAVAKFIEAGRHRYEELTHLKFEDEESRMDLKRFLDLFDQRIYELEMSQQLANQKGMQIRMLQENNRKLALKIQSSILNTIPLWQDQLSLALAVEKQAQTAKSLGELLEEQIKLVDALQNALKE
ncbi:MAG: toxic anion resistance protein [Turicibacter sp.]|nr:toxic anion resistance protein [Turicibacter sp.]